MTNGYKTKDCELAGIILGRKTPCIAESDEVGSCPFETCPYDLVDDTMQEMFVKFVKLWAKAAKSYGQKKT